MKRILVSVFLIAVLVGGIIMLAAFPAETGLPALFQPEEAEAFFGFGEEVPQPAHDPSLEITFSEAGHFFPDGVTVAISSANPAAEIHYTLNGSIPTTYSLIYSEPLEINTAHRMRVIVLRAKAVYGDEVSAVKTHTFFVGEEVDDRFTTMIFSLSTERDHLYCFYTGIFVEGATRRDYRRENRGHLNPTAPANFNWRGREGERPVHVEAFHVNGERVLTQDAGMRVFGSWSRAEPVKSVRLIARREYSPHAGRFHYQFFPDHYMRDEFRTPVRAYDELILRNGGNDRNHGVLRNELGSELARRAGFEWVTPVRAAVLFINGEYYGHMWLQTRTFEHFLQEIYGTPTRDFDVIGRGEWWFRNTTTEQEEALRYKNEFAWRDLNNEAEWARFNEIVCVDNLLWYYAFQIFLGNADWPHNNVRRWRYTGEYFPGMSPELDGRWRYIIFDLDQTFGLFGQDYRRPNFQEVLVWNNDSGQLIRNILTRQDMAERFTMMMNDIAANVVNYNIVSEVMWGLWDSIAPEVEHALNAGLLSGWTSFGSIDGYHQRTLEFARRRHITMFEQLSRKFGFEQEFFNVNVTGGEAIIGTQRATSSRYFAHLTVPVVPVLPEFTVFEHWVINGVIVEDAEIFVTAADAVGGTVSIELVTRQEFPALVIYYVYISEHRNEINIVNRTDSAVRTDGLFLSNRREELDRFAIPPATIEPGGVMRLAGRDSLSDAFRVQMNFNVREGRRVFLSDAAGNILDTVIK